MDLAWAVAFAVLAVALLLDIFHGEYPTPLHPVVWIGSSISLLLKLAPRVGWWRQWLFGLLLAIFVPGGVALACWAILRYLPIQVLGLQIVVGALLLKSSFALRELGVAAERVRLPIAQGNLAAAREALRGLCSRDPSELDEEALLGATIQSVAENLSDSFVAPLFYYALLGIPGALAYRAINTLDAMIGYRGQYESLGKASARLDDVVNFIPARITAALLLLAGSLTHRDAGQALRIFWRDRARTPSPNGGRPMAMMAGLLGVQLEKKGTYILGDASRPIAPATVAEAWRLSRFAAWLGAAMCAGGIVAVHLFLFGPIAARAASTWLLFG